MTDAAIALGAPSRSLALSEHRNLRFVVLFLLYVAQGLPFGLFQVAIPAWLAQNGASAEEIGAVFALFMAFQNFGNMAASASLGWLDSHGGIPAMFAAMAVCSLTAAAFAFAKESFI